MIGATALELVVGLVMETVFEVKYWDYSNQKFNYKGVICLESTIAWGFYTIFMFGFLQRFVNFVSDSYSVRFGRDLAAVVVVIYTFDFSLHLFKAKMNRMPRKVEEMKERVSFYIGKR